MGEESEKYFRFYKMKINPKNYQLLFRLKDKSNCLINELLFSGPLSVGNSLIIDKKGFWAFYIDVRKNKRIKRMAIDLYGDKERYKKYSKKFRLYLNNTGKELVKKYKKEIKNLTESEFIELFNNLTKFWNYYGFLEYVFHDYAYEKMIKSKNNIIKENFKTFNSLKLKGRKLWNYYVLENGVIYQVLKYFSEKYFKGGDQANYLYFNELLNILLGKKLNNLIIKQRKNCYVAGIKDDKIYQCGLKNSLIITDEFFKYEKKKIKESSEELKGVIANSGRIKGRVVISPMLDIKEANKVARKMKNGDILVVQSTNPSLMSLCKKAGAIITNQGGMLSHAAIISRELNIPCIVGTINGTKVLNSGDFVEVNANEGVVKIIKRDENNKN